MSKHLNEEAMVSELGNSAFFSRNPSEPTAQPVVHDTAESGGDQVNSHKSLPGDRAAMTPRGHVTEELVETIRRAVKQLGKEDATYRFTTEEKQSLADIVYTYGSAGVRTSQNEITRIGINYLLDDYRTKGANSILALVLERLNA